MPAPRIRSDARGTDRDARGVRGGADGGLRDPPPLDDRRRRGRAARDRRRPRRVPRPAVGCGRILVRSAGAPPWDGAAPPRHPPVSRPREPFWTCFAHDLSICVLITLTLGISMSLYDAQRRRLDAVTAALRERELEHERARKMALEARLASLEARLQPHFMFNTLNAISPRLDGGRLRVEATVRGDQVRLSVWDDGPGFRPDAIRAGHGLDNLRGRLAARFGADASLEIGRRDGGTLVTVALPRAGLS